MADPENENFKTAYSRFFVNRGLDVVLDMDGLDNYRLTCEKNFMTRTFLATTISEVILKAVNFYGKSSE